MLKINPLKVVELPEPVWPKVWATYAAPTEPWLPAGKYFVTREFDEDRYVIRVAPSIITLLKKSLTIDPA